MYNLDNSSFNIKNYVSIFISNEGFISNKKIEYHQLVMIIIMLWYLN
jgi:hypothetical protein